MTIEQESWEAYCERALAAHFERDRQGTEERRRAVDPLYRLQGDLRVHEERIVKLWALVDEMRENERENRGDDHCEGFIEADHIRTLEDLLPPRTP